MTPEEAINCIDDVLSSDVNYDESLDYELTSYDIDWLEKAKEALEMQIPKEPIRKTKIQQSCPNCGGTFTTAYVTKHSNCWHCGQALKIDGKEENNATQ